MTKLLLPIVLLFVSLTSFGNFTPEKIKGTQKITNVQGHSLIGLILNKSESQILVERDDGYRFKIEKSQLDDATIQIVEEWESPIALLLSNLKTPFIKFEFTATSARGKTFDSKTYSKRAHTSDEFRRKKNKYMSGLVDLSKKYGEFQLVNDDGYQECILSLWSILQSLSEGEFEETCARASLSSGNIVKAISVIDEDWPFAEGQQSDLRETLKNLKVEIGKNLQEISSRKHKRRFPPYFISKEVADLCKSTVQTIGSIQEETKL